LAKQNEAYQALKTQRDTLKAQYDGLVAQDDAGELDADGIIGLEEVIEQF
jgi:hypothetical protein